MPNIYQVASFPGVSLQDNERSYVIQVISEINAYVRDKDVKIRKAGGERTINGGSFVKFPDILLFSDDASSIILQGWEAKCPDVAINDEAFVKDAHVKADLLKCNSTVLWNFQYAELHLRNDDGEFYIAKHWDIDSRITDRSSIKLYESEWKAFLHSLIDVINDYIVTGDIKHRSLGTVLTDSIMPEIVNENKCHVSDYLKQYSARDVSIGAKINNWWAAAKKEYAHDETDPFTAYAKILLVNWLHKFLFANIIQSRNDGARLIGEITAGCKVHEAIDYFQAITERCDYFNVFSGLDYQELIPDETWADLVSYNELLQECCIQNFSNEYSHKILEESISVAKRQIAGQYPTPEPLAKLMSEIAIRDAYGDSIDCCCGSGTIGCAIWERKRELLSGVTHDSERIAYQTTWLSDIHDFPLQVATQSFSTLSWPDFMPLETSNKESTLISLPERSARKAAP